MARRSDQPPDLEQLVRDVEEATFRRSALWLDGRFTEELSRADWDWPVNPTKRDVVDTGRLRSSQTRQPQSDGSVVFSWPVEYATAIHEGYVLRDGNRRMPGRPWTQRPLDQLPAMAQKIADQEIRKWRG